MSLGALVLSGGSASVAVLCWALSRDRLTRPGVAPVRELWALCAALCALVALNAGGEFDTAVLSRLRAAAQTNGWYAWRRPLQAGLLLIGVAALWRGFVWLRARWARQGPWPISAHVAWWGCWLLLVLGWSRWVSWHAMDVWMHWRWYGVGLGRWLELVSVGVVGGAVTVEWAQRWSWR